MLSQSIGKFKRFTKHPELYLQARSEVAEEIKCLMKDIYDFTKKQETDGNSTALPELFVEGFDDEQIWQQLELQNNAKYDKFISDVSHLLACRNKLYFQFEGDDDIESNCDKSGVNYEEKNNQPLFNEDLSESKTVKKRKALKANKRTSVVDDHFFKLSQLEMFLEEEDRKELKKNDKSYENDDSGESIDLFNDIASDESETKEGGAHYDEFFDNPEIEDVELRRFPGGKSSDEDGEKEQVKDENDEVNVDAGGLNRDVTNKISGNLDKQVRFDLSPASTDSETGLSDNDRKRPDEKLMKSCLEVRQERLQERIKALEAKALEEKPWQMKGEVAAASRPSNSLLAEVLEYDVSSRPAPVMTEQTTLKLEDIIIQRIKDKAWDDVERKVKPTIEPGEFKKKLVMDHEKSKLSLAEIYEQEYLKQKDAQDPNLEEKPEEEPKEHTVIRSMTSSLFAKLDALTNFHYTPKPVIPEVKIVSNLPAITMEEVAPIGMSDATLLAPEEVKPHQRRELMSKEERTVTDKKRERRMKKKLQRIKKKDQEKREKIVEKLRPGLGNKYSKEKALESLEKLSNEKNVHQLEDGKDKGIRSSAAFFNRLQDEVSGYIKSKSKVSQKVEKEKFSNKLLISVIIGC